MKTTILTIFSALILSSGIAKTKPVASAPNANATAISGISHINKIEVYGNVELYVSDDATNQVKVYNKFYAENAIVQNKNGVLRIVSYETEKLVVWVTADQLNSISAYDNSEIKSFGIISNIDFSVDLHNNASASLNLNAYSANVIVNDMAKANISGTVNKVDLKYSHAENVNATNLETEHAFKTVTLISAGINDAALDELTNL